MGCFIPLGWQRERRRIHSILGQWRRNVILREKKAGAERKGGSTEMSENDLFHEPDSGYPGSSETGNCEIQESDWDRVSLCQLTKTNIVFCSAPLMKFIILLFFFLIQLRLLMLTKSITRPVLIFDSLCSHQKDETTHLFACLFLFLFMFAQWRDYVSLYHSVIIGNMVILKKIRTYTNQKRH